MSNVLIDILFKEHRKRALTLLYLNPDRHFYVRDIARRTNTQPGTINKELLTLAHAGLLIRTPEGMQVYYQANKDCPIYEELYSILRKTTGFSHVIKETLAKREQEIELAVIYGLAAQPNATGEEGDVQLLVVGSIGFAELFDLVFEAQEALGREIKPKLLEPEEWQDHLQRRTGFMQEILNRPVITLLGSVEEAK